MDCNIRCCAAVIFVAIVATLASKGTGCLGLASHDPGGHTDPEGDIFVKYGDSLKILCVLNSSLYNSSSIVFTRTYLLKYELVDQKYVQIINETAAELVIDNHFLVEGANYVCAVGKGVITPQNFRSNIKGVCMNVVTVGLPPQEVNNFSCISQNWDSLYCSWKDPHNYITTFYNLSYVVQKQGEHVCPNVTKSNGWYNCLWNKSTSPIYRQPFEFFTLILSANNKFGRKTWEYNISHYAVLLPNRPENVNYTVTSNSISLSWDTPKGLENFPPGLAYELSHKSEFTDWAFLDTSKLCKNKCPNHLFYSWGNLLPHTTYQIKIRSRSNKSVPPYLWSEPAVISPTTLSSPPFRPPRTDIGSFEIRNLVHEGKRDVYLYWQQLPNYEKNGDNLKYKIVKVEEEGLMVNLSPSAITEWCALYKALSNNTYKFFVTSTNDEGDAPYSSEISVPNVNVLPPSPEAVTKIPYGNGTYELSWRPPINGSNITGYTVFWCENRSDQSYCSGVLNWTKVDRYSAMKNITVAPDRQYQFAVSAESGIVSSGLTWVTCTLLPDRIGGRLKHIQIISSGSDYVQIGWRYDCSDQIGVVQGFRIFYCPKDVKKMCSGKNCSGFECKGTPLYKDVNDTRAVHAFIRGLQPYTKHIMNVSVIIKGHVHMASEPIEVETDESSPEIVQNVTVKEVTNTTISLSWQPPAKMNGIIRQYIVYCNDEQFRVQGASYLTLGRLKSWTDYNISVSACTLETSCSEPSEPLLVKTLIGRPGSPPPPRLYFDNYTQLVVEWSPPTESYGIISSYDVLVELLDGTDLLENITETNITSVMVAQIKVEQCFSVDTVPNLVIRAFVRAVSIGNDSSMIVGDWSPSVSGTCYLAHALEPEAVILISVVGILSVLIMSGVCVWIWRWAWFRCKKMKDVGVKLPDRLKTRREIDKTDDHSLHAWDYQPKDLEKMKPSPDQQLLLDKKEKEDLDFLTEEIGCGDESGCGSGQESVSSVASGTHVSTDSGTEADSGGTPRGESGESAGRHLDVSAPDIGGTSLPPLLNGTTIQLQPQPNQSRPQLACSSGYVTLPAPPPPVTPAATPRAGYVTIAPFPLPVAPDQGYAIMGGAPPPSMSPHPISPVPVSPVQISPLPISPVAPSTYCVLGQKHQEVPKSMQSFSDPIHDEVVSSLHSN